MHKSPREHAIETAEFGRKVAHALTDAIAAELPLDADLLHLHAHRIKLCSSTNNLWLARDLHNKDGELFNGSGRFWLCGSKLCPYCLQRQSQRMRAKLRVAIEAQRLMVNEHWHFLTFTMPKVGLDLLTARSVLNMAWSLFRKKVWFQGRIAGYFKSEEFTTATGGVHYHCHVLARSRYIEYSSLRHFWTESLRTAFLRHGKTLTAATSDGMAIANCRRVGSVSEAVNEVAKYLTKSSSWRKVPTSELLDLARIRRWPRMCEFGGTLRLPPAVAFLEVDEAFPNKTILDTKSLSDGEPETGWRSEASELGAADYLEKLHQRVLEQSIIRMQQLKRHFAAANFWTLKFENPIDIEQTLKMIVATYARNGLPPPAKMRKNYSLVQRLELNREFGTSVQPLQKSDS